MAISIGITKPVSKPKNGAKNGYLHPIKLQNTKIEMENTIWPLKMSQYELKNWNWRVFDKIIQICKICISALNQLKAIAGKEGSYVE